ncbi:hypothetical protein [Streptomyces sp. NPDC048106]|uniref:hypothetical protein n=1 Tax=Streptomyces sp. NPDC048106 TaxID=3155750 RepID=UPI003451DE12
MAHPVVPPRPVHESVPGPEEDWELIQRGYASRDMDEKWDVFVEGEVAFMHRSWTGYGIFAVTFAPIDGDGWRIASAVVERDAERYGGTDDAYDCVTVSHRSSPPSPRVHHATRHPSAART